jgi:hypothetical protein
MLHMHHTHVYMQSCMRWCTMWICATSIHMHACVRCAAHALHSCIYTEWEHAEDSDYAHSFIHTDSGLTHKNNKYTQIVVKLMVKKCIKEPKYFGTKATYTSICMCMYVYIYVCVYVWLCVCVYISIYLHMHSYIHVCKTHTHTHIK